MTLYVSVAVSPGAMEDMFHGFILAMDTFALGLIKAAKIIEDGTLDNFVCQKYSTFNSELGKKITSGNATLSELAKIAEDMGSCDTPVSGSQEYLQSVVNNIMFS